MRRLSIFASVTAVGMVLGVGQLTGCDSSDDSEALALAARQAELDACGLHELDARDHQLRACEPGNTKKTTVCHVPPGNPANAHTICIGNPAVKHHLKNHPDYLGPCKVETTCPPPASPDAGVVVTPPVGGAGGSGGTGGTGGTGGAGGSGGEEIIL
jgi:hypothetical protein